MTDSYSWGNSCPVCYERITNDARMCRGDIQVFTLWLFRIYGYRPKLGRRSAPASGAERNREGVLLALASGPMSTPELARAVNKTVEGTRYACNVLLRDERVEKVDDGYRHVWALVEPVEVERETT